MQQGKILTILIPSYNMEHYLPQCLDSMLADGAHDALEILVVNDGSKDGTLRIAQEYASKYPATVRIIDKENGNYGSCVNRGLSEAQGKYVKVVDADDSVDKQIFSSFVQFLTETDADLVLSDFVRVDEQGLKTKQTTFPFPTGRSLPMNEVCDTPAFLDMEMHAVTYRTQCLRELHYRQTEGISYTDQQWIFLPMSAVQRVAYFPHTIYRYLVGRTGQTMDADVKLRHLSHLAQCSLDMAVQMKQAPQIQDEDSPLRTYLTTRLRLIAKEIYITSFVNYSVEMRDNLTAYDEELHKRNREMYDYIGSPGVSSFMGFQYIAYWRKHKHCNIHILKIFSKAYMALVTLKSKLS